MLKWIAVNTQARSEETARLNLERQGFSVYLPRYLRKRRHARRTDWVSAPLFPRYLFVGLGAETVRWRAINSTIGVSQVVANGSYPLGVSEHIINGIRSREGDDGWIEMTKMFPYQKGDKVQILDGPLKDQVGLFDCADENKRVFILLDLLGRAMKVRMSVESVCGLQ